MDAAARREDVVKRLKFGSCGMILKPRPKWRLLFSFSAKAGSHSELSRYFIADDDTASGRADNELDSYITETFCYEPTELLGLLWPL